MCAATCQCRILIAVPSYENRVMPRFGQAREFHLAELDASACRILSLHRYPLPASVSSFQAISWLAQNTVQGVVCAEFIRVFRPLLHNEKHLGVLGYRGEVASVIHQWLADGMLVSKSEPFENMMQAAGRKNNNLIGESKNMKFDQFTGNTSDSAVNPRFSRAPWFMVYDDSLQTWTAFDNSKAMDIARGAGIQAAQTVSDLGAKVVISGIMGPKAYKAMNAAGIQIYIGASNTVRQAPEAYQSGKLTLADEKAPAEYDRRVQAQKCGKAAEQK